MKKIEKQRIITTIVSIKQRILTTKEILHLSNLISWIFIMKELLLNRINHARNFVDITDEQLEIILNCRKFTLHYKNSTWIKNTTDNFDIPMGAYDSTQISHFSSQRVMAQKHQEFKRKFFRAFKLLGFKIETMSNLKVVNFLDINVISNQPRLIIRQIPHAVNIRINRLSSNKKSFMKIIVYMMRSLKKVDLNKD